MGASHEERLAAAQSEVRVGAGGQETFDGRRLPGSARRPERGGAVLVRGVDGGVGLYECLQDGFFTPVGGPVQRGGTIPLCLVDRRAFGEQRSYLVPRASLRGVGQGRFGGRARGRDQRPGAPRQSSEPCGHGSSGGAQLNLNHWSFY